MMFGFGKKAEDWVESARKRYQKLHTDNLKLINEQVQQIRSGQKKAPDVQRELQEMKETAFRAILSDLDKALKSKPGLSEARFNKGYVHYLLGEDDSAIDNFAKVLADNPRHANALYCTATIKWRQDKAHEAQEFYNKALAVNPQDADAWWEMGEVLKKTGDLEGAKQAQSRAQELRPSLKPEGKTGIVIYIPMSERLFC